MKNIERFKGDLERLITTGELIAKTMDAECAFFEAKRRKLDLDKKRPEPAVTSLYEPWFSETLSLITQLLPSRVEDFRAYYKLKTPPKELTALNYTISDFLRGIAVTRGQAEIVVVGLDAARNPLGQQIQILRGLSNRFDSSIYDIKTIVHADLLDDELAAAEELNSKGFQRGAGAISGVVLESHLAGVCERNAITLRKKDPAISDLNDALKSADKIETATWRFIQHLGDLRNKCDHKKKSDPTEAEVDELIAGVRKITKTVF